MRFLQQVLYPLSILVLCTTTYGQDTLRLNRQQYEAIFLRQNYELLAEKMEIPKAEAQLLQAKLWPNPTVALDEVNLWAGRKQLAVFGDDLQGFNGGKFGRNQQVSFSIEQLILTAGKRKKLMALEQINIEKTQQSFEELLRSLKIIFRNHLTHLQHLQLSRNLYQEQIDALGKLTTAYQRQVEVGNIPKGEWIRLKALELELLKNNKDINEGINEVQKELRIMMRISPDIQLTILEEDYVAVPDSRNLLPLSALQDTAKTIRPDLKTAVLDQRYFERLFLYEKAQRVPNLTVMGGYDRGGNFMYNFVGFGLGIDLPIFHRNQGNIKYARIGIEQSKIIKENKVLTAENEIAVAYQNLLTTVNFYKRIETGYESTLDELLKAYTRNFAGRNINLLEFLDFLNAYLENKKIILDAAKEIREKAEELNYAVGKDILN